VAGYKVQLEEIHMKQYAILAGLLTMLPLATLSGQTFSAATQMSSYFGDAGGWNQPQYGTTIMFADINHDKLVDVCGRGPAGIYTYVSTAGYKSLLGYTSCLQIFHSK
jgi:hypothetical protein